MKIYIDAGDMMKTIKEMMKERGIANKTDIDKILEAEDAQEKEFKKRLKKACDAADINFKSLSVETKDDTFVLHIPLKQLIGPKTRQFAADRWNVYFEKVGIDVDLLDNIEKAFSEINVIVPVVISRDSFGEIE